MSVTMSVLYYALWLNRRRKDCSSPRFPAVALSRAVLIALSVFAGLGSLDASVFASLLWPVWAGAL